MVCGSVSCKVLENLMSLKPTQWSFLIGLILLGASFGWSISLLWPTWFYMNFFVPWYTALAVWLIFVSMLTWALMFRYRMKPENLEHRVHPIVAARTAAAALASSRIGSIIAGVYAGIMIYDFRNYSNAVSAEQTKICGMTALPGLLLVILAMWLENMCRLPESPPDSQQDMRN